METIIPSKCETCGKEVLPIWNACPKCGTILSAGKNRASIPSHSFRK